MTDEAAPTAGGDPGAASARATAAILRLMDREGISRSELARRLEASPAHVTQILRGDTNFTLASLEKLAAALGATLEVRLAPVGEGGGARAREEGISGPPATGGAGVRGRTRRDPPPRRRPRPRPAPTPDPDSSWRVW